VALRPQDLRIGRNFADKQAALTYPKGWHDQPPHSQDHLANLIVNSNNYHDSSANALDNLENLAYSRDSGLIAGFLH
jgi:hypothetical protein